MVGIKNLEKVSGIKRKQVMECVDIVSKYPIIKKMIIFGSSVSDRCTEQSDVDICFDIDGSTRGIELYSLSRDVRKACEYKCDILTYGKLKGRVKDEIDSKGVTVYELS